MNSTRRSSCWSPGSWPLRPSPAWRRDWPALGLLPLAGRPRRAGRERDRPKPGETAAQAIARLESFVAETIAPPLGDDERASARQMFAFFLGTADIPDFALAQNPYGAALSLARREQLGIDAVKLNRAFDALTEADLRRAAGEIFAPARHAAAFISPGK